jgi:hypothetical protein
MKSIAIALSVFYLSVCFNSVVMAQQADHWETAVFNNDTWHYFVGTSEPNPNWRAISFDDTAWPEGMGGFGYGDNDDNTVIPQCTSVYIRYKFTIPDTAAISNALLSMDYDDAFVAYLNDVEIARAGITGIHPPYNQTGTDHEAAMYLGGSPESFTLEKKLLKSCIRLGDNLLSIQVHNTSATSSDMSSNAFLSFGINNTSHNFRPVPSWFSAPSEFSSSNLPLVIITTDHGARIVDEPKIPADMKIIYNGAGKRNYITDSANVYSGRIGIEIRGSYSALFAQKPYGIETRDSAGNNRNVSILGMPADNDWVLLANYLDKTFLRNVIAFDLFKKMGHYSTRMRYVEVIVNNEYQGIYLLGEKIKQGKGRVDIAKLNPFDNSGNDVTGGYIIKNDYYSGDYDSWISNFSPLNKRGSKVHFVYHDPKPDELTSQQKTYIQGFINTLETVLYSPAFKSSTFGYKSYINTNSFADYFILGEVSRNVDAYKKSRFFYKNKDSRGGLLQSGPAWDFDWAWRDLNENCINFDATDGSGWAYRVNDCDNTPVPPSWEIRMLEDGVFTDLVRNRYFELRKTILSQAAIEGSIDSAASLLNEAQTRHFDKWKILGVNPGPPETGFQPATYSGEIQKFKDWINRRLTWLDANMIGPANAEGKEPEEIRCSLFPNPVSDILYIESDNKIGSVVFYNVSGFKIREEKEFDKLSVNIDVSELKPGIYFTKILFSNGKTLVTKVIKM